MAAGQWRPSPADAEAAVAVLGRLTAALPVRRGAAARTRATDQGRRLQRVLRTVLHHLDAGAVSPSAAALLAAVAAGAAALARRPQPAGRGGGPGVRGPAGGVGRRGAHADRGG
ncbi:hypothetical protein ABZX74_18140 [Streptomyces olivaceoviridis]|uniref:hypothetical protein n=1 Tax=Streptomyces olivaceoviridis TaxID=1921 RepID=UPI0033A44CBD